MLILNSRRPEVPGTRIIAEAVPCANVVKSIACKRKITLVNIHSTRMLMAHGFLRRIFEVFDRHETPVDMVATSEVSVSLTIDNTARLAEIRQELAKFAEVDVEQNRAIVCLVGDNIRYTPGVAGRAFRAVDSVNIRMISQGASLLNLTFVVAEQDLTAARRCCTTSSSPRSTRRCFSKRELDPALRMHRMKLAIVGYGKMGKLIEQLAPEYGFTVALKLDEFNNANFEGITRENFAGVDAAIEFSIPSAVAENVERIAALGVNIVVGTTGWMDSADRVKSAVARSGIGLVWSPNYSVGVNVFFRLVSEAARLLQNEASYGAWAWEIHHIHQEGRAFGHAAEAGGGDEEGRLRAADRRQLEPRRRAPGHARNRFRLGGRHHHAAPHRAQPGGFRPRRAESGTMGGRQTGLLRIQRSFRATSHSSVLGGGTCLRDAAPRWSRRSGRTCRSMRTRCGGWCGARSTPGINFLVPCGTTGESPTLTRAEHLRVVEITLEEAKGKVPVLAGAGGYNTAEVISNSPASFRPWAWTASSR